MTKNFIFPVHVYVEDTDFGGLVYHANHIKFMERARTTWLMDLGFTLSELAQQNIFFIVRSIKIDYLAPARLNDNLEVISTITKVGRTSITFEQNIRFAEESERFVSKGEVVIVCINNNLRPITLPNNFTELFTQLVVLKGLA